MNTVSHQFLKFSLRCWKYRNTLVNGATKKEQNKIALQKARERISDIYANPPPLDPTFRSIYTIPLAHRLKLPLQAAEQWISMIHHQAKVTSHNFRQLLSKHQSIDSHFRTMRRIARQQAKDRRSSASPRKARSRAVQAALKSMREKLYNFGGKASRPGKRHGYHQRMSAKRNIRRRKDSDLMTQRQLPVGGPAARYHPP